MYRNGASCWGELIRSHNLLAFHRVDGVSTNRAGILKSPQTIEDNAKETGGILLREYCFGEENSLSLTEFRGKLCEFCEKLGELALAHK